MKIKQDHYWISMSDMMTGLMIIFLFISVAYMIQLQQEQKEKNQIINEYINIKNELLNELKKEFESDFSKEIWDATIDSDLSIKFNNEYVLFDYNKSELKEEFKKILDNFFPRYFNILLKDRYKSKILEVRIEGHTDSSGDYIYNLMLSNNRAAKVLEYFFISPNSIFNKLNKDDQNLVKFWLTATGFSYGRVLDKNGLFVLETKGKEDAVRSRRVEFRVLTKSEALIEEIKSKD